MRMVRKPAGWPRFMRAKRLKDGSTAYYWEVPSAYPNCKMQGEALGSDYAIAKTRCDELLNPNFNSWRLGQGSSETGTTATGSFDWLVGQFQKSPQYRRIAKKTRRDYDNGLAQIGRAHV